MVERFARFQRLSAFERSVVLEAAGGLLATWLGLRLIGFRRWERVLAVFAPAANATALAPDASEQESALLDRADGSGCGAQCFVPPNCLEQSLVL